MIRQILAEVRAGTTTVHELSRKLSVEESALQGMLQFMVRKGLVRELHPGCRPKGCRGCRYQGKCQDMPVTGYEVVSGRGQT
jgi:predicted transcriptional regulator